MHSLRQPANYVIAISVAAAVVFGTWLIWPGDMSGADGDSVTNKNITGDAPADLHRSASSPGSADNSSNSSGQSDSTSSAADGTAEPGSGYFKSIPIPGDFAGIVEREGRLSEFHERLEREIEDPDWALPLERELEDFLNKLLDPSQVAVKLIECRSDSCEILAVGYGEQAMKEWLELAGALYEAGILEEWFQIEETSRFDGGCGSIDLGPGVFGLLCEFSRAVPPATDDDSGTAGTLSLTAPYPDGVEFIPVPIPDDFVRLFETNADVYDFHRALQAEPVDHSWAPFVENQISEHFSAIPELESVTYHHIECRMTRCEVQLTIHDPQTAIAWTLELRNFNNQAWIDLEFTIYNVPADGDPVRIVWLMNRKTGT